VFVTLHSPSRKKKLHHIWLKVKPKVVVKKMSLLSHFYGRRTFILICFVKEIKLMKILLVFFF